MLKNIVSKFSDRGKDHSNSSENNDSSKVSEGFLCPKCLGSFSSPEQLQSHYQIHHDEPQQGSQSPVTLKNSYAFYDDSTVELEEEANGGSSHAVSSDSDDTALMDESELRRRLATVIQSCNVKDQKVKMLESRANNLTQEYAALKAHNEKEKTVQIALQERIKVLEAQLAQRASLDDATALRQGLIQVQQAMDQMALDRERERDEYKERLQCLQDTVNKEAEYLGQDREKLLRVFKGYLQLQVKMRAILERIVNAQLLIDTNQLSFEQTLQNVNEELEWLKKSTVDAMIINYSERKQLKELLARGNLDMSAYEQEAFEELDPDFKPYVLECIPVPEENQVLQEELKAGNLRIKPEIAVENLEEPGNLDENESKLTSFEQVNLPMREEVSFQNYEEPHDIFEEEKKPSSFEKVFLPLKQDGSSFDNLNESDRLKENDVKVQVPVKEEPLVNENSKQSKELLVKQQLLTEMEKEKNALEVRSKELENKCLLQCENIDCMKDNISDLERKLKQLNSQMFNLCSEDEVLKSSMEKLQKEKTALDYQIKELEKVCANHSEDNGRMKDKILSLEDEMKQLNSELTWAREEENLLRGSLAGLEHEKSSLKEEIKALREKYNMQEEQVRYFGVQRTSLETSLFELQKSFTELELEKANIKKSLEADIVQLKEELSQLEIELKEVKGKEEEAREKVSVVEDSYKEKVQSLEKENQDLQDNFAELQQMLLSEKEIKNDWKKQMEETKNTVVNLESQLEEQKKIYMQELDKKIKALEEKQAALDEVAGEKLALEAQVETLQMEQKALLERCYASTAEAEQLRRTHVEACRSQEEVQAALQELGRENQTLQMKMDKLLGRKWAEDSEVANCSKCAKEFSLIVRKHHCRNCFKIFCNECSSRVASIEMDKKPVRVCDSCFNELAHK